jgi:hypothetical protein
MGQELRKATDVLLDLETKVDTLIGLFRASDLNNKILSNKLNEVIARLDRQQGPPPKFIVETVQTPPLPMIPKGVANLPASDPERNIPFVVESNLPQDNSPQGFRRNSRPETYVKDKQPPQAPQALQEIKLPMQIPTMPSSPPGQRAVPPPPGRTAGSEIIAPPQASSKKGSGAVMAPPAKMAEPQTTTDIAPNQVAIMQRCVDKNGKSIFLANVEIVDINTMQTVFKTRTIGNGKWMAALDIGSYRVTIRKMESVTKEKIEAVQDIQIDGSQSRMELPMLIIK